MVGLTFQHLDGGASTNALKLYPPSKLRLVTFYSRFRIKFIWRWSVLYFKLLTFPTCMSAALYNGTCLKNLLIFPTPGPWMTKRTDRHRTCTRFINKCTHPVNSPFSSWSVLFRDTREGGCCFYCPGSCWDVPCNLSSIAMGEGSWLVWNGRLVPVWSFSIFIQIDFFILWHLPIQPKREGAYIVASSSVRVCRAVLAGWVEYSSCHLGFRWRWAKKSGDGTRKFIHALLYFNLLVIWAVWGHFVTW